VDTIQKGLLGLQVTLIGLLLGTLFGEVPPYDIVAFVLGIVGTILVLVAVFESKENIDGGVIELFGLVESLN